MADKAISELVAAEQIKSTDMFVLEQEGTAKRLQGQTLLNWLTAAADGHGGISNIAKTGTDGLVDTYTITLADTTTQTFTVTNGNGLTAFEKLSTVGLVDTYRFTRSDGTYFTFAVANGAKGDTGEASHVWIKYASQQPTASSHSMGDLPDAWMGVYSGTAAEAPDDWQQYTWYQIKGEKGDTGAAATVTGTTVEYMVSDSGTIVPSGSWSTTIPTVPQGKYLWTKVTTTFNSGSPAVSYSVARMGIDGAGSVSSVNEKSPGESGNVSLLAEDIPTSGGGSVQDALDGKQGELTAGENISISGSVITTKAFPCNPNLLDNWYFGNPVNQRNGKIIQQGVNIYADSTLETLIGPAAYACPVVELTSTYAKVQDTENTSQYYYAAPGNVVQGYTGQGYGIDRWRIEAGVVISLSGGALVLIGAPGAGIVQNSEELAELLDKRCTFSVLTSSGDLYSAWLVIGSAAGGIEVGDFNVYSTSDTLLYVRPKDSSPKSILAVKLELGTQQTIAHQENGKWVLNEIPKFGDQLAECQRYARNCYYYTVVGQLTYAGTSYVIPLSIPQNMRAAPAITLNEISAFGWGNVPISGATVEWTNKYGGFIRITDLSNMSNYIGKACFVDYFASADL